MNKGLDKNIATQPYIECDGWYACCPNCWEEIEPVNCKCPKCNQLIDWTWLTDKEK